MQRHGYSLASIFLVTTVAAVMAAAISTGLKNLSQVNEAALGVVVSTGIVLGVIVGTTVAYGRTRKIRRALVGLGIGLIAGAAAGLIAGLPQGIPAVLFGAVIVMVYALVVRGLS